MKILSPANFHNEAGILEAAPASVKQRLQQEPNSIPLLSKETGTEFLVWKDATTDLMRWFAIYSNNFRDQDNPPEIIAEKSHQTYVDLVDSGIVDYPELWLWHIKGTAWGKADWVAYDHGFAMASGLVYKGYESIAERLMERGNLGVSHGMIKPLLVYDPHDKSVILFHVTTEISPLPDWAAANALTGFTILDEGDMTMALPEKKRSFLKEAGKTDAELAALDSTLAKARQSATDAGIQSKETSEEDDDEEIDGFDTGDLEVETDDAEEEEEVEVVKATPVAKKPAVKAKKPADDAVDEEEMPKKKPVKKKEAAAVVADTSEFLTKVEAAEVIVDLIQTIGALSDKLDEVTKELKALQADDEDKIAAVKEVTPTLSLMDMISSRNPIGKEAAKVKGNTLLGKDGPKETQPVVERRSLIPFIDDMQYAASHNGTLPTA